MKVSLNWIKDYVDLPADMDLKRLAYDLTMSTVEVEDTIELAKQFDNMVVGRIKTIEQHPNADKLKVCKTDIGGRVEDIVCGGSNLREGMKVAVALPGAMCKWHGEGDLVEIKKSKLRGVDSYGMICGAVEIGLGDLFPTTEEAHILDLSAFDAPAGTPIADALDLNDIILEIDNKSMTNRPDLCEFQCNGAMPAAKTYHKAPIQIANAVKEQLSGASMFESVEAVNPGFLNFKLSAEFLASYVREARPLPDAEPHLAGGYAAHQRPGGYHQLCDAGHRPAHPRL